MDISLQLTTWHHDIYTLSLAAESSTWQYTTDVGARVRFKPTILAGERPQTGNKWSWKVGNCVWHESPAICHWSATWSWRNLPSVYFESKTRSHLEKYVINLLNAELNPICHLLALLGGATIVVVSGLRVKAHALMPGVWCHDVHITYISNEPVVISIRCSTPVWHQPHSS